MRNTRTRTRMILQTARMGSATSMALLLGLGGVALAGDTAASCGHLPVRKIEQIVGIEGTIENGVLALEVERTDIGDVAGPPSGPPVVFTPAFEIGGDIFFQPLGHGDAFLNGDLALEESEVNPFIAALVQHGLVFQAFHQHLPMMPQIWFVHFRGTGDAIRLARAVRAALDVTGTPLPQMPPPNPTTPLDADRLARILHGHASVGDEGVVTVWVYRTDPIFIDGVRVNPQANISTNIQFKPLGGSQAAVVPDFSMESDEVQRVVRTMLVELGWYQGCLYNQETDEHPQLYFDHMLKVGDAYALAHEIRRGLDSTDAE